VTDNDVPTTVYHYTTTANALNIFTSGELWATDLRYCNDATETKYGRDEVLNQVTTLAEHIRRERVCVPPGHTNETYCNGDDPEFFASILDRIAQEHHDVSVNSGATPFGVAFSKDPDKLSQWRGYAGHNGCAIGVDRKRLIADFPAFQLQSEFCPVAYGPDGVEAAFTRIKEYVAPEGRTSTSYDSHPHHAVDSLAVAARALLSVKDKGFAEEEEVRLLFSIPPYYRGEGYKRDDDKGVPGFRVNAMGLLVPYWVVPINREAITEVWVGPGVHQEHNIAALHDYFEGRFTGWFDPSVHPEIRSSEIPFQ
jgi:hypothetical protein